jgi:hypothetical protein
MLWISLGAVHAACVTPVALEGSGCDPDHPCPAALACQEGACVELTGFVVPGCETDEECAFGVCCAGACAQCCVHDQCFGAACLDDRSCGCTQGDHCATGRCNVATSQCLSCYSDIHCESGSCDLGSGVCGLVSPMEDGES